MIEELVRIWAIYATRDRRASSQGVGHPPSPFTSSTYIHLQVIDCEADALPLLWELNSGGGVNCGASM